jgi:hypothetical protein
MRLADLRTQYREGVLELADLDPDPLRQFEAWLADAVAAGLLEPNAMGLATADPDGAPSLRMVLLKGLEDDRFVFYTHLESRKAVALAAEAAARSSSGGTRSSGRCASRAAPSGSPTRPPTPTSRRARAAASSARGLRPRAGRCRTGRR